MLLDHIIHDSCGEGPLNQTQTQNGGLSLISGQLSLNADGQHVLVVKAKMFFLASFWGIRSNSTPQKRRSYLSLSGSAWEACHRGHLSRQV